MGTREFTAVYEQCDGWWTAWVEELGGAFGQGRTMEDCRESLKEAILLVLEAQREIHDESADPSRIREPLAVQVA